MVQHWYCIILILSSAYIVTNVAVSTQEQCQHIFLSTVTSSAMACISNAPTQKIFAIAQMQQHYQLPDPHMQQTTSHIYETIADDTDHT